MDLLLSSFNIEEDSEVYCGYSLIINGKSSNGSDSGPNNETPSDSGPSLGPSNLDPYDSSTASSHPPKSIKGSHYHSVGTRMLALTRKRWYPNSSHCSRDWNVKDCYL